MRVLHVVAETPLSFLQHLKDITFIERKPLKFCAERLTSLVRTLELTGLDQYSQLQKVAAFATLVATYEKGAATLPAASLTVKASCSSSSRSRPRRRRCRIRHST